MSNVYRAPHLRSRLRERSRLGLVAGLACALGATVGACGKPPSPTPHQDAAVAAIAASGCAVGVPLDYVTIDGLCDDGGDPNEDVDVANGAETGKKHTPRPVLPPASYTAVIQARRTDLGFIRVRSRLVFSAHDLRNVVGTIPSCTSVKAAGPMKNSTGSQGIGYSIRLKDPEGHMCQGFVAESTLVVKSRPTPP